MKYAAGLLLLVPGATLTGAEVDEIYARMLQWREGISSLKCELTYNKQSIEKGRSQLTSYNARWVETRTKIYRRIERAGAVDEYVWEDGVQKALFNSQSKTSSETGSIGAISKDMVYLEIGSPWIEVYLSRIGRPSPPLPKFLRDTLPPPTMARVDHDGRPCVKLMRPHPVSNAPDEWIIDPATGLLLSSTVCFTIDRQNRIERTAQNVSEVAPGIFFPGRVIQKHFRRGALAESSTITFTKVVVNGPIDSDTMHVSFAPNTSVLDDTKRIIYRTDEHERPVPGSIEQVRLSKEQLDEVEAARPWYHRWSYWLGIAGILVILTSAQAYVRQRRRMWNSAG